MQILPRHKIDAERWDRCVRKAWNEAVYGYSWFLDACCQWEGVVVGDYEAVMALPVRQKWGIRYVYMPYACQKLGVYSAVKLNGEMKQALLKLLSGRFKLLDLAVDDLSELEGVASNRNIELNLQNGYDDLLRAYGSNAKRNVKKAAKCGVVVEPLSDFGLVAELYRHNKVARGEADFSAVDMASMTNRFEAAGERGLATLLGAKNGAGELLGGALFVASERRYYFLFSGLSDAGKQAGAMFAIVDAFIKMHAGEAKFVDFEGSNHDGVARFYSSFGGQETTYYRMRMNRLPWPLNWLKR